MANVQRFAMKTDEESTPSAIEDMYLQSIGSIKLDLLK